MLDLSRYFADRDHASIVIPSKARDLSIEAKITLAKQRNELVCETRFAYDDSATMLRMKTYFVYMMTNRSRVILYVGVTNSIERRLWYHGNTPGRGFTKRYKVDRLVYSESYRHIRDAIAREKEIKGWRREKKNDPVRPLNPKWQDLSVRIFSGRC
jgi:putative endonuclease